MAKLTADEIITSKHKRAFIQYGGPRPDNELAYGGQNGQYMAIQGVTAHESGDIDPSYVPDPRWPGRYRLIGRKISPADLNEAEIIFFERHGAIPKQLTRVGTFNVYEVAGRCRDLSDFLHGWEDYVLIYSNALVGEKDLGDRMAWDEDENIEDTLSVTLADIYPIGQLSFGEGAAQAVTTEVLDIAYGTLQSICSDDVGNERVYAVTKSDTSPAGMVYSVDGGRTWQSAPIAGIGATENPVACAVVGGFVLILSRTAGAVDRGGYYLATLNANGVPGAFTKVTSGFLAGSQPNDVYVAGPREVYFVADGGFIYQSTDVASGVRVLNAANATSANLLRIHGQDDTLVAVGASGTVVMSTNRGRTWATTLAQPAAANIQAVAVLDEQRMWVGTATGSVFVTANGGASWMERQFGGTLTRIDDIVFATDEVGYVSAVSGTTARIFATWNGGADWTANAPRIQNLPTFSRANRLAVPSDSDAATAANNVAVAGLGGGGTDGLLLLGVAATI